MADDRTDDRAFNPLDGNPLLGRADVADALEALFAPLRPCFSLGAARVRIDASGAVFDQAAAELEGFARPLWGLAAAAAGGLPVTDWPLYRRGLANGTDPAHPDYWGAVGPVDQRMVELAAIGFALRVARRELWDPLDSVTQARVIAYLQLARICAFSDNNWKFFRLMIDLGLEEVGVPIEPVLHNAYLDEIDQFHLGEGWYRDGRTAQLDHYIPFAFHFYGLLYATLARDRPPRRAVFETRARAFAGQIEHWFADDGAALPFGRSLTYRFAAAGFWGALAVAGVEALPWGVIKGHYLRHLRWWSRQPITRRDGILSLGYAYPNPMIVENYSSAMSPYWAFKAFLPLMVPAAHPFWIAEEQAPAGERSAPVALVAPGMVIRHEPGQSVALSSGQANPGIRFGAEKYAKFAYSTRYAFSIESDGRAPDRAALDSSLGLIDADGVLRVRERCLEARIGDNLLYARWQPWPDVDICTWLWWDGPWQLRLHEIDTRRPLRTLEGGFAIAAATNIATVAHPCGIAARSHTDLSGILCLSDCGRNAALQRCEPNTNLIAPRTLVPQLGLEIIGSRSLACAVLAGSNSDGIARAWENPPRARPIVDLRRALRDTRPVDAMLAG